MRKNTKYFFQIFLIPLSIITLAACATSGNRYEIDCSGDSLDWEACLDKASELCNNGYNVVKRSDEKGSIVMSSRSGKYGAGNVERTVIIECK